MATNKPNGPGRKGAVKNRSQFMHPLIQKFVKRNSKTGKLLNIKADKKPFKGVRKEK